nr:nascent polypeptide-associated complex subunit alpha, muscle-specific form-like [Lytechinus pictus]
MSIIIEWLVAKWRGIREPVVRSRVRKGGELAEGMEVSVTYKRCHHKARIISIKRLRRERPNGRGTTKAAKASARVASRPIPVPRAATPPAATTPAATPPAALTPAAPTPAATTPTPPVAPSPTATPPPASPPTPRALTPFSDFEDFPSREESSSAADHVPTPQTLYQRFYHQLGHPVTHQLYKLTRPHSLQCTSSIAGRSSTSPSLSTPPGLLYSYGSGRPADVFLPAGPESTSGEGACEDEAELR